ncbi:MAG: c-type cytochrome [Candidatus Binatia bacterium]
MPRWFAHPWRLLAALLFVALVIETAYLSWPVVRDIVMPPDASDVHRGQLLAAELGCFNCHGPGGTGGVPNPGSKNGEVPSFRQGTLMMFAHDDHELREYILDGAPAKKRSRPAYQAEMQAQAIRMPAYRGVVSNRQVELLVAYLRAASDLLAPSEEPAARGAELAQANGCFGCHGAMGGGGLPNPGSLKGYIPGFGGPDYEELVQSDEELRTWIAEGGIPRLLDDRAARFFIDRQRVQMPAFKHHLAPADVDALVAYVKWIAAGTWRGLPLNP